jgi:hypothetical protein
MARRLMLLVAIALLVLAAAPLASQAATKYVVRDNSGKRVGFARNSVAGTGRVLDSSGAKIGSVWGQLDGDKVYYFIQDTDMNLVGTAGRTSKRIFLVTVGDQDLSVGRAVHEGSKWVLQRRIDGSWVRKGSVSEKLRGQVAGGALRLLLW